MHGATYKDICIRILMEHLYLLVISILVAFIYLRNIQLRLIADIVNFDFAAFGNTCLVFLAIMIIVSMIPIYSISKNTLNYLIKGNNYGID